MATCGGAQVALQQSLILPPRQLTVYQKSKQGGGSILGWRGGSFFGWHYQALELHKKLAAIASQEEDEINLRVWHLLAKHISRSHYILVPCINHSFG